MDTFEALKKLVIFSVFKLSGEANARISDSERRIKDVNSVINHRINQNMLRVPDNLAEERNLIEKQKTSTLFEVLLKYYMKISIALEIEQFFEKEKARLDFIPRTSSSPAQPGSVVVIPKSIEELEDKLKELGFKIINRIKIGKVFQLDIEKSSKMTRLFYDPKSLLIQTDKNVRIYDLSKI